MHASFATASAALYQFVATSLWITSRALPTSLVIILCRIMSYFHSKSLIFPERQLQIKHKPGSETEMHHAQGPTVLGSSHDMEDMEAASGFRVLGLRVEDMEATCGFRVLGLRVEDMEATLHIHLWH
jgi:hypothetical protein